MNTNPPNPQESSNPGQAIEELINDMRELTSTLDSFALSFTLAWRQHPDQQRQDPPSARASQPERTTP
jgi:hypothetical protein